MRKLSAFIGMLVVSSVIVSAHAASTVTNVIGAQGRTEQTCLSVFPLFFPQDCTVSGWADLGLAFADTQQGPLSSGGFYAAGTAPDPRLNCTLVPGDPGATPPTSDSWTGCDGETPGDGKANLAITGTVTVDDNGRAGTGTDDIISFVLTIEGGQRNTSTSVGEMSESWTSIEHTLPAYAVDSATPNGSGGFDYVIGSAGMMFDICTSAADAPVPGAEGCFGESEFGSNLSGDPLVDVNVWTRQGGGPDWTPASPLPSNVNYGLAGVNNNVGGITTAVVQDYVCINTPDLPPPNVPDPDCAPDTPDPITGESGFTIAYGNGGAHWDNLVMTISTDGSGNVISAKGFYVYMYDIILGGFNSWVGGSFSLATANAVPVAVPDPTNAASVNVTTSVDVLANDTDLGDQPLMVNIVTPPAFGTAVVTDSGGGTPASIRVDYTYTDTGVNATDSFTYEIVDATPDTSNTATVTMQIANLTPTAVDDGASTDQGVDANINVLLNDTQGDTPIQGVTVPGPVTNGSVVVEADNSITYSPPNLLFIGTGSFDYVLTDFNGDTSTATVTVNVVAANVPSASDDTAATDTGTNVSIDVLANDAGLADTPLTVTVSTPAANGTATPVGSPGLPTAISITYAPDPGFAGTDTFVYTILDNSGDSDSATVTVTVNDLPVAVDDAAGTDVGNAVNVAVLANDSGLSDTPITVTILTAPANGTTVVETDNSVTYTPDAGFAGSDSFVYTVTDTDGDSDTATATVTVNDLPVAVADAGTASTGGSVTVAVLANDSGLSDAPLTVTTTTASNGSIVVNGSPGAAANISVTYPNSGAPGVDTFSYTVTDADGDSDSATVAIAVSDPNIPMPVDDTAETNQNTAVTINVLANDAGLDDVPITVAEETAPGNGTITINGSPGNPANINVTYTPASGFSGTDSFVYRVTDDTGDTATATVTITVIKDEIVITIPSGGSAFGPWGLALLLIVAVPVLRRRWTDRSGNGRFR